MLMTFCYCQPVHLHKMLEICQSQGEKLDVRLNPNKSCLFTFRKDYKEQMANIHFGAGDITWVDNMKYLGINFCLQQAC